MGTPRPSSVAPNTPSSVMVEICNDFVRCATTSRCWRAGGEMMNTGCISNYCWTSFNVFNIGCQHDAVCSKAIGIVGNFTKTALRHVCVVDGRPVMTFAPGPATAGNNGNNGQPARILLLPTLAPVIMSQRQRGIPQGGGLPQGGQPSRNYNMPPGGQPIQRSPTIAPVLMSRQGGIPQGGGQGQFTPTNPPVDNQMPPHPPPTAQRVIPTQTPVGSPTWANNPHNQGGVGAAQTQTGNKKGSSSSGVWIGILIGCFAVAGGVFWYLRSKDLRNTFEYGEFDDLLSTNGITDDHL